MMNHLRGAFHQNGLTGTGKIRLEANSNDRRPSTLALAVVNIQRVGAAFQPVQVGSVLNNELRLEQDATMLWPGGTLAPLDRDRRLIPARVAIWITDDRPHIAQWATRAAQEINSMPDMLRHTELAVNVTALSSSWSALETNRQAVDDFVAAETAKGIPVVAIQLRSSGQIMSIHNSSAERHQILVPAMLYQHAPLCIIEAQRNQQFDIILPFSAWFESTYILSSENPTTYGYSVEDLKEALDGAVGAAANAYLDRTSERYTDFRANWQRIDPFLPVQEPTEPTGTQMYDMVYTLARAVDACLAAGLWLHDTKNEGASLSSAVGAHRQVAELKQCTHEQSFQGLQGHITFADRSNDVVSSLIVTNMRKQTGVGSPLTIAQSGLAAGERIVVQVCERSMGQSCEELVHYPTIEDAFPINTSHIYVRWSHTKPAASDLAIGYEVWDLPSGVGGEGRDILAAVSDEFND
eukprot:g4260.t1